MAAPVHAAVAEGQRYHVAHAISVHGVQENRCIHRSTAHSEEAGGAGLGNALGAPQNQVLSERLGYRGPRESHLGPFDPFSARRVGHHPHDDRMAGRDALRAHPGDDRVHLRRPGIERWLVAGRGQEEHVAEHPVHGQLEGRELRSPVPLRLDAEAILSGRPGTKEKEPVGIGDRARDLRAAGGEQNDAPTADGDPSDAVHDLPARSAQARDPP